MIWHEGSGTLPLTDYLAQQGIAVPAGWDADLAGGFGGISGDGLLLGGWTFGPSNTQSYIIRLDPDVVFADGFDPPAPGR